MSEHTPAKVTPGEADGAKLKQSIAEDKADKKTEPFDPGASMLGTDNEAGAMPDEDGMAEARRAKPAPAAT